ncbi:RNA recognition motif domain-containing protein [Ditylenchus destructor]|uniref:RNA recognition motif domain-containing protein n=1 Tax=Ditylenchus destructor TaxID=166010 RepID=A0AAD4R591_9BILA|nr:RNA recognition motif domain-containing protein [Ditylenchus destructor]
MMKQGHSSTPAATTPMPCTDEWARKPATYDHIREKERRFGGGQPPRILNEVESGKQQVQPKFFLSGKREMGPILMVNERNVNHEETRKLSLCASSSAVCYTDHSKEKMLSVTNLRRVMSQIYSRQSFSFSSRFNSLQQSHLEGSLLAPPRDDLSLILGILPPSTTLDSVKELFSRIGQVTHLRFGYVKAENGTLNKYSYVTFATKEQLAKALEGKYRLNGQRVTVKPKKDTPFSDDESDDDEVDSDRKKKTNRSLGYAYVAFSTAKVVSEF